MRMAPKLEFRSTTTDPTNCHGLIIDQVKGRLARSNGKWTVTPYKASVYKALCSLNGKADYYKRGDTIYFRRAR